MRWWGDKERSEHEEHERLRLARVWSSAFKMSAEDYAHLEKAAAAIWPGAVLTRSSIVLGLAKMGADAAPKKKGK